MKNEDTLLVPADVWEEIIDVGRVVTRLLSLHQKLAQETKTLNWREAEGRVGFQAGKKDLKRFHIWHLSSLLYLSSGHFAIIWQSPPSHPSSNDLWLADYNLSHSIAYRYNLLSPEYRQLHFGHCTLIYYPTKEAKVWSIRHQESSPVVFLVNLPNFYNLSYLHTVFTLHTLFGVCKMAPRGIKRVRKYQNICMHDSWICALKQKSISCRSLPKSKIAFTNFQMKIRVESQIRTTIQMVSYCELWCVM